MRLLENSKYMLLYVVEDDYDGDEQGKPIYIRFIAGNYGPWIEIHKEDPRGDLDSPRLPENQVNIDYFERNVRVRIWEENALIEAGHEDVEPIRNIYIMNVDKLEQDNAR